MSMPIAVDDFQLVQIGAHRFTVVRDSWSDQIDPLLLQQRKFGHIYTKYNRAKGGKCEWKGV